MYEANMVAIVRRVYSNASSVKIGVLTPHIKSTYEVIQGDKLTGGRLNKKDGLTRYGDSHVKDKTS